MPTQLLCPQCRVELPGSLARNEPGECPRCKTAFAAPRVKSSKSSVKILQSKPFTPPPATKRPTPSAEPTPDATTHVRGPLIVTALAALLVIASIAWVIRMPDPERPAEPEPTPAAPIPVAKIDVPADEFPVVVPPGPLTPKQGRPKVRPLKLTEPAMPPGLDPGPAAPLTSAVPQDAIDKAIANGVRFLKSQPHRWLDDNNHRIGHASLPALALLEVGTPPDEPVIVKAADIVRRLAPKERETYDLSLAILFLDKLGDPADDRLIRTLGLRLVAGQTRLWGWDYHCPLLNDPLEPAFLAALEGLQPKARLAMALPRESGKGLIDLPIPLAGGPAKTPAKTGEPHLSMPLVLDPARAENLAKTLPVELRDLPIVRPEAPVRTKGRNDRDDNSNTQFALLALWAARRHGVPVERSLLFADRRFAQSQLDRGGWGYHVWDKQAKSSMTCVGLLGLALGHGAVLPDHLDKDRPARAPADPAVDRGLSALAAAIGQPGDKGTPNLYLLWSVERVGVLYNLPRIGGKDWYGWGASQILRTQRADGSWPQSEYPGSEVSVDTAFALLFLGRSNLVPDLTQRLRLHMPIADPER